MALGIAIGLLVPLIISFRALILALRYQFYGVKTTGTISKLQLANFFKESDEDGPRYRISATYVAHNQEYELTWMHHSFKPIPKINSLISVRYLREQPWKAVNWSGLTPFEQSLLLLAVSLLCEAWALIEHFNIGKII